MAAEIEGTTEKRLVQAFELSAGSPPDRRRKRLGLRICAELLDGHPVLTCCPLARNGSHLRGRAETDGCRMASSSAALSPGRDAGSFAPPATSSPCAHRTACSRGSCYSHVLPDPPVSTTICPVNWTYATSAVAG